VELGHRLLVEWWACWGAAGSSWAGSSRVATSMGDGSIIAVALGGRSDSSAPEPGRHVPDSARLLVLPRRRQRNASASARADTTDSPNRRRRHGKRCERNRDSEDVHRVSLLAHRRGYEDIERGAQWAPLAPTELRRFRRCQSPPAFTAPDIPGSQSSVGAVPALPVLGTM
jgi:hypothetical protein